MLVRVIYRCGSRELEALNHRFLSSEGHRRSGKILRTEKKEIVPLWRLTRNECRCILLEIVA